MPKNTRSSHGDPFLCPHCGNEIGKIFEIAGGVRLLNAGGGSLATLIRGTCKVCGRAVFWDMNEKELDQAIKNLPATRNGQKSE